jgi:centriolin
MLSLRGQGNKVMCFRLLQADAKDLEQHKIKQEEILKEINKVVAAKDADFQCLNKKKEKLTEE